MNDFDQGTSVQSDDALEQLLKQASPRPTPSPSDEAAVRQAVRAEWRQVSGRHQSRRRFLNYAIAATVLIGVFSVFSVFRMSAVEPVQVASIEKSFGSIFLVSKNAGPRRTQSLTSVLSGQTIETGDRAGLALAWGNGGSIRIDENTRVEFIDDTAVYVKRGRIYFDSRPSTLIASANPGLSVQFVVRTDLGLVTHSGTQFMAAIDDETLVISIREGRVSFDGKYHDLIASSGKQLELSGNQFTESPLAAWDESWRWVSKTSPSINVEGRSFHDFLEWVSRETGLTFDYEGRAEQIARQDAKLKGTIDAEPLEALQYWSRTTALRSRIVEGVIYVSDTQ